MADDDPEISSWLKRIISNHSQAENKSGVDEIDDLTNFDDMDLNFFKKYRKNSTKHSESEDEEVDISEFIQIDKPIEIEYDKSNEIDQPKNTFLFSASLNNETNSTNETLSEARQLLNIWADQTDSFQPPKAPKNTSNSHKKVVQYRKLEMPMMVAKKPPELKVNDPTAKTEERLKQLREKREKRLAKQAENQILANSPPKSVIRQRSQTHIPDIDLEIKNYRQKMNDNIRERQQKIENREKNMKRIETNCFDDSLSPPKLVKERSPNKPRKTFPANPKNIPRNSQLELSNNENNQKVIEMRLQIFLKNRAIKQTRFYFTIWSNRCLFNTQSFKKATVFSNFRERSRYFSIWHKKTVDKIQKKELVEIEQKFRERKRKEKLIQIKIKTIHLRKVFLIWRMKYKMKIELENGHYNQQKRLEIISHKIGSPSNNNSPKARVSPSSPKTNKKPIEKPVVENKKPAEKIKMNKKIEEMEKRNEEAKKRKLEKLQMQIEQENLKIEQQRIENEEKIKKNRLQHLKELNRIQKEKEEERLKKIQMEQMIERTRYLNEASAKFNLRRMMKSAFLNWSKILAMKNHFNQLAISFHRKKLKEKVFIAFSRNSQNKEYQRILIAEKFYSKHLKMKFFDALMEVHERIKENEKRIQQISLFYLKKSYFQLLARTANERKQERFKEIQNTLRLNFLRRVLKAWPIGCAAIREDEEREENRHNLFSKALQYLDEISSDEL